MKRSAFTRGSWKRAKHIKVLKEEKLMPWKWSESIPRKSVCILLYMFEAPSVVDERQAATLHYESVVRVPLKRFLLLLYRKKQKKRVFMYNVYAIKIYSMI
jgi:hypothetical protein